MIEVKVSKYIPAGFVVMVGTLCKKCKRPFDPLTRCVENIPYGHVPDVVILQNIGEAQPSVQADGFQSVPNSGLEVNQTVSSKAVVVRRRR